MAITVVNTSPPPWLNTSMEDRIIEIEIDLFIVIDWLCTPSLSLIFGYC